MPRRVMSQNPESRVPRETAADAMKFFREEGKPDPERQLRRYEDMQAIGKAIHNPRHFVLSEEERKSTRFGAPTRDYQRGGHVSDVMRDPPEASNNVPPRRSASSQVPKVNLDAVYGVPTKREDPNAIKELLTPATKKEDSVPKEGDGANQPNTHHQQPSTARIISTRGYEAGQQRNRGYVLPSKFEDPSFRFGARSARDPPSTVSDDTTPAVTVVGKAVSSTVLSHRTRNHVDPASLPAAGGTSLVGSRRGGAGGGVASSVSTFQLLYPDRTTATATNQSSQQRSSSATTTPKADERPPSGKPTERGGPNVLNSFGKRYCLQGERLGKDAMWDMVQHLPEKCVMKLEDFEKCWAAVSVQNRPVTPNAFLEKAHALRI
eukprot:PhF_6_TR31161/c0_g1_i3/m.45677